MKAPQSILVGTDLSAASIPALEFTYSLASALQASVHLVAVLDPSPFFPLSTLVPKADMWANMLGEQQEALREKVALLGEQYFPGMTVTSSALKNASPASAIADLATEGKFDLVVVGSHGRTGVGRMLLGSVAEKVVRLAPCPTLVVRST